METISRSSAPPVAHRAVEGSEVWDLDGTTLVQAWDAAVFEGTLGAPEDVNLARARAVAAHTARVESRAA